VYELYAVTLEKDRPTLQRLYEWKGRNSDYTGSDVVYFMDAGWLVPHEIVWIEGWSVDVARREAKKMMPSSGPTRSKDSLLEHGYGVLVSGSKIHLYDPDAKLRWEVQMSEFPRYGIGEAKWKYSQFASIDGTAFNLSRPGGEPEYYLPKESLDKIAMSPDKSTIAFYIKDEDNKIYGNRTRLLICVAGIGSSRMTFVELTSLIHRDFNG